MKNHQIRNISILIICCLLGLLTLQAYWIYQSIQETNKQFDRGVYKALGDLNEQLQEDEIAIFLSDSIFSNSTSNNIFSIKDSVSTIITNSPKPKTTFIEKLISSTSSSNNIESDQDEIVIIRHESLDSAENHLEISINSNGIHGDINGHWVDGFENLKAEINFEELDISKIVEEKSKKIEEVMVKMLVRDQRDLPTRFPMDSIEIYLEKQLRNNGVDAKFDYLVQHNFSENPNRISGEEVILKKSDYNTKLFQSELDDNYSALYVAFPNKISYLLREVWGAIMLSFLFVLVLVSVFTYTIRSMIKQRKISELKNDFVANMTHELKTPITTINLACDTLREQDFDMNPESVKNYVSIIAQENERLQSLVNNVLESSFFDSDKMKLEFETVNLTKLVEEELNRLQLRLDSLDGELKFNIPEQEVLITGDHFHLTNCVRNLLDNALKYGEEKPIITVTIEKDKIRTEYWNLLVKDKGLGIPAEEHELIFDKFHRVQKGNIHDVKGFGLGLHYVKRIVELHHGSVSVKSKLSEGSTFSISLPKTRNAKK